MTRQQQRNMAIRCANKRQLLDGSIKPSFQWSLLIALFGNKLKSLEPVEQALEIIDNRALFGEVLVTLYDYNIDGFSCIESGRGELLIAALYEAQNER